MAMRYLLLKKRYAGAFPGEVLGWEDPKFSKVLAGGYGLECDKDGVVLNPEDAGSEVVADTSGSLNADAGNASDSSSDSDYKFDEKTDPFIVDGLAKTTSQKLHNAGLHTPDDVRKYLADGKALSDLSVNAVDCRKAAQLYVSE